MKTIVLLLSIFITPFAIQAQKTVWAKPLTHDVSLVSNFHKVCTDSEDNFYIMANFARKINFGTIELKSGSKSPDVLDAFIAKIDPYGETIFWGIQISSLGNVYVAANVLGMYDDWVHDPALPVEKQYLGKVYYEDEIIEGDEFFTGNHTVIVKLSPDGDLIWKRVGALNLGLTDLAIDDNENTYLTGAIGGSSLFEGKKMEANGLSDIIVIKFDNEGKTAWIKQFGTGKPYSSGAYATKAATDIEGGQFIAIDANENIYFTGVHFDGAKFDDKTLSSDANIKGMEVGNAFLAKLDNDGNIQWIKNAEGKGTPNLTGMVCDKTGNVYLAGAIVFKKVTFDGKKAKGPFIMKFDTNGEIQWIDDADTRDKSWGKTVKVRVSYISDIAINKSEDFLYTTGNAVKETKETDYGYKTSTTTTITETLISVSKVKTE